MTSISVLLRLLREPLAEGRLIGRAEVVETGETTLLHSTQDLTAYLREQAQGLQRPSTARDGESGQSQTQREGGGGGYAELPAAAALPTRPDPPVESR